MMGSSPDPTPMPVGVPSTTKPADEITIEAIPGRRVALCGVKNTISAVISIATPPSRGERAPVHVACVLDKSGSMQVEDKMKFSKRAVRKLVRHLRPPDVLHFVTYDTHAEIVFTNGDLTEDGKAELVTKIKAVQTGSATNLVAGAELGAQCLRESAAATEAAGGLAPGTKRVFLFSDGIVNQGVTAPGDILSMVDKHLEEGISTTTFGVGHHFDEALMTSMAKRGQGEYAFLSNEGEIPRVVAKSVHALLDLAGTGATLNVRGLNGAVVTKVYGDDDGGSAAPDGGGGGGGGGSASGSSLVPGQIDLGDLHNENVRRVLVEIEIAPTSTMEGPPKDAPVLEFVLAYTPTATTAAAAAAATAATAAAPVEGSVEVVGAMELAFSDDRKAIPAEDPRVTAAVAIQSANDADDKVLALVANNSVAKAIEAKKRIVTALDVAVKTLESHPDNIGHGSSTAVAAVLAKANAALEGLTAALNSGASDEIAQRMRYEQRVMRRMSDDGMDMDRADSECAYSDDGSGEFDFRQQAGNLAPPTFNQVTRRYSSDFDDDGSFGSAGSIGSVSDDGGGSGVNGGMLRRLSGMSAGTMDDVWPGHGEPQQQPPPPPYTPMGPTITTATNATNATNATVFPGGLASPPPPTATINPPPSSSNGSSSNGSSGIGSFFNRLLGSNSGK